MSFFKSKRSNADSKSSSKSSNVTESDSKTQKGTSATPSSKSSSSSIHSPPPPSSANTGGVVAPNSRQTLSRSKDRKTSIDMQEWLETECPIDSRMMTATLPNNALSISRSGRFKAKGKMRARLFSEDGDSGPQDDHSTQAPRGSTSLSTPEDRQTVLEAMSKRTGAATPVQSPTAKQSPAGGSPLKQDSGANRKSSDRGTSSNWSTTPNSTDL